MEARRLWARIRRTAAELAEPDDKWAHQLKGKAWPAMGVLAEAEGAVKRQIATGMAQEQLKRMKGWEEQEG